MAGTPLSLGRQLSSRGVSNCSIPSSTQFRSLSTCVKKVTLGPGLSGWRRRKRYLGSMLEEMCSHKPLLSSQASQVSGTAETANGSAFSGIECTETWSNNDGRIRDNFKGWMEEDGSINHRVMARLRILAASASDRSRMHRALSIQRDNWNHLFNVTLSMATITAAALSAAQGCFPSAPSLPLTAFLLNTGSAAIMSAMNRFQPSQLAEEQRAADRFFRGLCTDIEAELHIHPRLREDADLFLEEKIGRLHAIDKAFPLPLTPVVLPRFPTTMQPTRLCSSVNLQQPRIPVSSPSNGWTAAIAEDLEQVACRLGAADGDVQLYQRLMARWVRRNQSLAVASPLLAAMAAAVSCAALLGGPPEVTACAAALLSVMAVLAHSLTNCLQLGMVFELYRNCSGYSENLRISIVRSLCLPVEKRQDGQLFHQKVAIQLGRKDQLPLMSPGDLLASKLF